MPYRPWLKSWVESKNQYSTSEPDGEADPNFLQWHERGYLPHRDAPGLRQFITFHTADAMPAVVRRRMDFEYKAGLTHLDRNQLEDVLDRGYGQGWLRDAGIVEIVLNPILQDHLVRCMVKAWCVMPNHVHLVIQVQNVPMARLIRDWKGVSAYEANKRLRRKGASFWAADYWDTYVRDDEHERRCISYTERNPQRAYLIKDYRDWPWSSYRFRNENGDLVLPGMK